ncbi:ankyrin repeat domain-containing protein 31 [Trichosurus vulpecula]|uniref:ankyrin repeat domain-containing protein 31 n=1 Tax=Trichosurus vulpecula TaxID=9337 RepID=UPI00186B4FA6|nr:ankyrin repeat domain-containing protein 31 [Trichosurus vulpecula]
MFLRGEYLDRGVMNYSLFTEEGPQDDHRLDSENQNEHNYPAGFDAEDLVFLQRPEKELSDGDDSPEISLLSGAVITTYGTVEVKKKSSEKLEGSSVLSESLKEVALSSREIRGEDSSCEMLVPTIEDSTGLSESLLGEYPFIVNEFETRGCDLGSPKSMPSLDHLLICREDGLSEDRQEHEKNNALPAELLTALNTLSQSTVKSICQRMEGGSRPCAEDDCLGTEPSISQIDDDCTQIAGMDFEFQHSVQPFEQGPKLTEPLFKDITMQQDKEDPGSFGQETLAHQNVACHDGLSMEGNLNSMETNTVMETSYILRRSARLKTIRGGATPKNIDEAYKMPEEILQKRDSTLPTEYFRTQDSALQNNSDEKSVEWSKEQVLSAYSCDEEIRKNRRTAKSRKHHRNISKLSSINRRDIYGESPLHKAAQADDSTLVKKYIKLGGNVNLADYAGWTALHEASVDGFYNTVLELLKGGADVNCKGMKQITPIYDAVSNGHYKVAELLLQNGADPLFRNDYGKCALDEASDLHMKQLLENYAHKPRCPTAEQRNRSELLDLEDTYQHKKPEHSPRSTQYFNNENSRGIKDKKIEVSKRNKRNLPRNKGAVNENHHKISKNKKLIPPTNMQTIFDQINAKEPPKINMQDVHEPKNFVPMGEKKSRTITKRTEMSGRKSDTRTPMAPSSKRITRSIAHRQQDPETFCDLPEKSGTLTHSVTPVLKSHLCHDSEVFSVSKERGACENDTTSPTLMSQEEPGQNTGSADNQKEPNILESETAEPAEAIALSGLPFCEEAKLPLPTEGNDHTAHHEKPVPCEASAYNNLSQKSESVTAWEKCFLSFVGRNVYSTMTDNDSNDDGDGGCLSEGTVLPKKMTCFVNDENQSNCKANSEHEEESSSQYYIPSETQSLLQENAFQAGSLMTISQQDIINLSDSDCTIISERYVVNDGQNIKRITSDVEPEQIPLASTGTPSMPDLSKQISGVEISTSFHNNTSALSSFISQTDERMTNERGKESSERTCTEKTQESHQKSTECTGQSHEKEATKMKIKQPELAESDVIPNKNMQSIKNMNEDIRDASQLRQGTEKTIPSQSDKDMTDNVNKEQNTERGHKEAGEKRSPDTHVPRNLQLHEKRVQIKRKRQDLQETTNSQDLRSSINTKKDLQNQSQQEDSPDPKASKIPEPSTFGKEDTQVLPDKPSCGTVTKVHKRNAKGKSHLHLAAKRGDLLLVKALIESGAHLNQKDNAGWTALHEAANKGFNEVMVELLKAGANVNSESLDGLLPIHSAVSGNHLKAAEILLQHGANPNQKDGDHKSALDRAEDEKMKKLLKSCDINETREICHNKVTAEKLSSRLKRQKQESCCKSKRAGPLSFSHQDSTRERAPMHESTCAILQDIEEKQESLLLLEIRTPKDADQYSEKMLQIKAIMDSVLAKQKKERDDLAKKYRVSMESFKHGALREQLTNLATRQKSLLMVAQKQKKLSQKIQNYKNTRNKSGLGVRGESPDSRNSSENDKGSDSTPVETRQPDLVSVPVGSPASLWSESGQETHCATESRQEDNQNLDSCISERGAHEKAPESECFSFNGLISKGRPGDPTLERTSESSYTHGIQRVKFPLQQVTSSAPAEYLQEENYTAVITAKGSKSLNPSAITETLNVLETTNATVRNNTHQPGNVCQPALTSCLLPGNMAKKVVPQDPPRAVSEWLVQSFLTHQGNARADRGALLKIKPNHTESGPIGALVDNTQINFFSESANQNDKQEPLNYRAEMKIKKMQIKELISLGRIKPGNDVLEFKIQDAIYKASILLNGKIKAKNGEIYKNPITWIKAVLGSNISVTWKYAWNKVTYLGKELYKYATEEVPIIAEPNVVLQENQPCLPGSSSDSVQNLTHYLQLNEILLISNEELLPCHIMDQHWKFYTSSKDRPF